MDPINLDAFIKKGYAILARLSNEKVCGSLKRWGWAGFLLVHMRGNSFLGFELLSAVELTVVPHHYDFYYHSTLLDYDNIIFSLLFVLHALVSTPR